MSHDRGTDMPAPLVPTPHRPGVLHGRIMGRRLRAGQTALLADLLPRYLLPGSGPFEANAVFGQGVHSLRLEIGFGGGEHLFAAARAAPDTGFIGCEPFRNGVVSLLQALAAEPLPNLRIHVGDGGEVLDRLGDATLARVDLLYPDPWPKRRQRKRRFVSAEKIERLARVLRPGGVFRFATDIDDYAGWTLARLLAAPGFQWDAERADDWRHPWPDWVRTRYEAKAVRAGRQPAYLGFTRR